MNRLNCDSSRLAFVNESVPAALDHDVAPELERVNIVLLPIHGQRVSLGRVSEDGQEVADSSQSQRRRTVH